MNDETKTPESQLKWQKEYDKNRMRTTGVKHSIEERAKWDKAADDNSMKIATFVRACVTYCIDNNIDLSKYKKG